MGEVGNSAPILSRPYAERQLIVVAGARSSTRSSVEKKTEFSITSVSAKISVPLVGSVEVARALNRLEEEGLDVLTIDRQAADSLVFPVGHPRDQVLYIGHPAIPNVYYTAASFHRFCFEHKFAEAIRLSMALGAKEIEVEHIRGWSTEFSARLNVPLATSGVQLGGEIGASKKVGSNLLFKATLPGNRKPALPKDLVWFHHEPTWQQIAEGRLEYQMTNFQLTVTYEDDFGVNAGLKATVSRVGLDLGGKFEDHESTIWRMTGEFGEPVADSGQSTTLSP